MIRLRIVILGWIYDITSWFSLVNTTLDTQVGGTHNPSGAQYSRTCYYMAKFMKDYQTSSNYEDNIHLWVMYRYGEVLLIMRKH